MTAVVAFLDDLFFTVKIADASKRAGLNVTFAKTEDALFQFLAQSAQALVVIDLNCAASDPIAIAARVKREFPSAPVIGFVSHVQTEVREKAQHAGCDLVVPRSVFSTRLPDILREYSA